jgi:hypothetical protein
MKAIRRIKDVFKAIKHALWGQPQWAGESEYPVQYAFTWEGVDYFCFTDPHNIPYHRGLTAMAFMEEVNMKITHEFLDFWIKAFETEMNRGQVRVLEIVRLINMIKERRQFVVEPDTLYKLASVMFFTKQESPLMYDVVYNGEKIKAWKRSNTKFDFFLRVPFQELFPFLTQSQDVTRSYFKAAQSRIIEDLITLRLVISQDEQQSDSLKQLDLQIQELTELISSD